MKKMISLYLVLTCVSMMFCFAAVAEVTNPTDGSVMNDTNRALGNNGFGTNNMGTDTNDVRPFAANGDNDFGWGWIGLIGLLGLTGLRGRNRDRERT